MALPRHLKRTPPTPSDGAVPRRELRHLSLVDRGPDPWLPDSRAVVTTAVRRFDAFAVYLHSGSGRHDRTSAVVFVAAPSAAAVEAAVTVRAIRHTVVAVTPE